MAKLREGRGGSTLKILYVFRSLLPLSWQSGLFLKQHKWKSSKLSASFSHRPQNNLRDHFFLYTYCSTPIVLPWRFSFKYFRAIYWSLINYELFTLSWYQSRDFPKVTEPDSCARCWLFLNIYKRENLSSFFFYLHSSTSFYGTCFAPLTGNLLRPLSTSPALFAPFQFAQAASFHHSGSWESFSGVLQSTDPGRKIIYEAANTFLG